MDGVIKLPGTLSPAGFSAGGRIRRDCQGRQHSNGQDRTKHPHYLRLPLLKHTNDSNGEGKM
jgi:hypothetical protein